MKEPVEIKKLSSVEVVKSRPEMYWGVTEPTFQEVNNLIILQLESEGCEGVEASILNGWQVISCNTNWFSFVDRCPVDLFGNAMGFPGGGGNGLRFEYFLSLIASNICILENGNICIVKGKIEENSSREMSREFKGKTLVAYKMD